MSISNEYLRALRNDLPLDRVIARLEIPTGRRGRRTTFRCPLCRTHHTVVDPRSNLGRCFRCARSFNPIDLAMAERGCTFLAAIRELAAILDQLDR